MSPLSWYYSDVGRIFRHIDQILSHQSSFIPWHCCQSSTVNVSGFWQCYSKCYDRQGHCQSFGFNELTQDNHQEFFFKTKQDSRVSAVRKIHAKNKVRKKSLKRAIQRVRKSRYGEKNKRESSDHMELRRVWGVKGRWERQKHQSFPAACWHTHWRQGYDPSGIHFLSPLLYLTPSLNTLFLCISLSSFTPPTYHIRCTVWHFLMC